jgi:5-methylcytosine-specific restriction endonuclease McrA
MTHIIDENVSQEVIKQYITHYEYPKDIATQLGLTKKQVLKVLNDKRIHIRSAEEWNIIKWGTPEEREQRKAQKSKLKRNKKLQVGRDIIAIHINKGCVDCGELDPIVLEFDHVDPTTKYKDVSKLLGKSLHKLEDEITKCQVVCANCHKRRTAKMFGSWRTILD